MNNHSFILTRTHLKFEIKFNSEDIIKYKTIGIIRTPFKTPEGTPIQPPGSERIEGKVIVKAEYSEGLIDLEGFSHAILLYHFHLASKPSLIIKPFLDDKKHGVFSTHAPSRPNPIGMSVVKILKRKGNILFIGNVDIVDQTPLLDIKPYVPDFNLKHTKAEWLEENLHKLKSKRDDGRFAK